MRFSSARIVALTLGIACVTSGLPREASSAEGSAGTSETTAVTAAAPVDSSASESASLLETLAPALDVTLASKYLFQGIDYSDGRSALQPNFVVSHGQFSAAAWANYQPDLGDVNEVDLSLKATRTLDRVTVSPGYTYLRYPNRAGWDPSQEVFADFSVTAPLNPTLSVHYDFDSGKGTYSTLGLSHSFAPQLSLSTNVFYQSNYYDMTGFPSVEFKAGTAFPFGSYTVTPTISRFATSDNGDFRGAARIPASWLVAFNVTPRP